MMPLLVQRPDLAHARVALVQCVAAQPGKLSDVAPRLYLDLRLLAGLRQIAGRNDPVASAPAHG